MSVNSSLRIASALLALGLLASAPAHAQFKVVDADGRVTYTDRPPSPSAGARVTPVRRDGSVAATDAVLLPLELRQAAQRFPVTLYSAAECAPCESARRLLQSRGVPHSERLISDDADGEALARLTQGRVVPTLTIGAQVMRGYAETDWNATLDLAGYPRESRLPRGYLAPPVTPLVAKASVAAPSPAGPVATAPLPAPVQPPSDTDEPGPSIRF